MNKQIVYNVLFTDTYVKALSIIKKHGRNIAIAIQEEAEGLAVFPEKKGSPLTKDLAGLWSRRVYHQRYRIIYRIKGKEMPPTVEVLFVGLRKEGSKKDVYSRAKKALRKK